MGVYFPVFPNSIVISLRYCGKGVPNKCRAVASIFCLDKLKKHLYNTIWGIKQLLMLGNDGEEGVTTEINKQTRCDLRD